MPTPIDLTNAITRYQGARPAIKPAMHASALAIATEIADQRDAIMARLDKRWEWCAKNETHPAFIEREDAVLIDLALYEQHEDALALALGALFSEAA